MGNRGEESQTGGIFGLAPASILGITKADSNITEHVFERGAAVWRIRWAGSHSSGINLASFCPDALQSRKPGHFRWVSQAVCPSPGIAVNKLFLTVQYDDASATSLSCPEVTFKVCTKPVSLSTPMWKKPLIAFLAGMHLWVTYFGRSKSNVPRVPAGLNRLTHSRGKFQPSRDQTKIQFVVECFKIYFFQINILQTEVSISGVLSHPSKAFRLRQKSTS
jgi:hypothetical protein